MLNELRSKLEIIDDKISDLLVERLEVSKLIGIEKKKSGWQYSTDKEREKIVINNVLSHSDDEETKEALKEIYKTIINEGKKIQDRILNK